MRAALVRAWILPVLVANAGVLVACASIVGVEDVRLRSNFDKDSGDEEDADETVDAGGLNVENVFKVALGELHGCARKVDGTVRCWGDDTQGQTGGGGSEDGGVVGEPREVRGIADAIDIAAGKNHTCVSRKSGKVSCWGYNLDGQLGNGKSLSGSAVPVDVVGMNDATYVSAGGNFSCTIRAGRTVACWGGNGSGQLGTGNETPTATPVAVVDMSSAIGIATGTSHTCALKEDGSVWCWGEGQSGQLGTGAPGRTSRPAPVAGLPSSVKVVAGDRSTCALTKQRTVYCWGANELGQLGNGAADPGGSSSPVAVKDLADVIAVSAGKNHTCAVRQNGTVACWGSGTRGQLGDGQPRPDPMTPVATAVSVSGINNATGIGAGGAHSCAPIRTGGIVCWGANDRAQLGSRSTNASELSPVSVVGYP